MYKMVKVTFEVVVQKEFEGITFEAKVQKESKATRFHASSCGAVLGAFEECEKANHSALFVPQIIDSRIANPSLEYAPWNEWYFSPSAMITGTSPQGNRVVVFAHIPTLCSSIDYLRETVENGVSLEAHKRGLGLRFGAGRMTDHDFRIVLDQVGNGVSVVGYNRLRHSTSGPVKLIDALGHPMMVPFVDGYDRAEKYIDAFGKVHGDTLELCHPDDFEEGCAIWRFLVVAEKYFNGCKLHDYVGSVLGIPKE